MNEFDPASGVTIENSLRYLEAIEQAIKREIKTIPKSERSMMLGILAGSIGLVSNRITEFRKDLEKSGESSPVTKEQKEQLKAIFRRARDKYES